MGFEGFLSEADTTGFFWAALDTAATRFFAVFLGADFLILGFFAIFLADFLAAGFLPAFFTLDFDLAFAFAAFFFAGRFLFLAIEFLLSHLLYFRHILHLA